MRSTGCRSILSVNDRPMLLPRTSMGASFHSQVLPWSSMDRTIGVRRATWEASRRTSQTASRAKGTTAVERLEAEKTVMGSIVGHRAVRCATGRRACGDRRAAPRETGATTERNWAGNHVYRASSFARPRTVEELQELVAGAAKVRALGSRHSFTGLADTEGVLVCVADLEPPEGAAAVEVDTRARTATVPAGASY